MMPIQNCIFFVVLAFFLGWCVGRFIKIIKYRAPIKEMVPVKRYYAENFKRGDVYQAIASGLRRNKKIQIETDDVAKTKKELAKRLNIVPEALDSDLIPGTRNRFYITIKEENNG